MSALFLKILAIVFMLVDHIGLAIGSSGFTEFGFSDGYWLCRAIGRLALPIFAFLIANGYRHTRSTLKYAIRLLIFSIVSEMPFDLFTSGKLNLIEFNGRLPDIKLDNIFFTLFLGLCFIVVHSFLKKKFEKFSSILSVAALFFLCTLAGFISSDYGVVGVAWVALFGAFDVTDGKNVTKVFMGCAVLSYWRIISKCIVVAVYRAIQINLAGIPIFSYYLYSSINTLNLIQPFSLVALGAILLYNNKSGMPKNRWLNTLIKYAFYVFYPLHLLVLWYLLK